MERVCHTPKVNLETLIRIECWWNIKAEIDCGLKKLVICKYLNMMMKKSFDANIKCNCEMFLFTSKYKKQLINYCQLMCLKYNTYSFVARKRNIIS